MKKPKTSCTVAFKALIFIFLFSSASLSFAQKSKYVDLFIGTAGDNGQVDPAACVPYGMVRVAPDSDPRSHSGYDYNVDRISGFSVNRLSGIGCSGAGGNFSMKPGRQTDTLRIVKKTESAIPGYYTVALNNGVIAEFTATQNIAFQRYSFPKNEETFLTFNLASSFTKILDSSYEIISANEIRGYIQAGNTCDHGAYKLYFSMTTSKPFGITAETDKGIELAFGKADKKPLEVRIAISPINTETAKEENIFQTYNSFDKIKKQATSAWDNVLSKIDVTGGSEENKTLFYTSLYRVFLSPANTTSWNNKYLGTDGEVRKAEDFIYYSSWSMWDSYRTKFPLITLLDAPVMKDISNSLCKLFMYGKKDWATDFESTPTVRTEHSIVVLLDAYNKGIPNIDLKGAYAGMKAEMETLKTERPDQAFETSIDLWAMSKVAAILGETADADMYAKKSKDIFLTAWEKDFKNVDDTYTKMKGSGLYQGTRWQYRWALPQYLDEMAESVGGKEVLAKQLDYFFQNSLNNQGNEPGIHAPFIFNRLGQPEKGQQVAYNILNTDMKHIYGGNAEYPEPRHGRVFSAKPEGYLFEMDEDDGTMSAWYVFASMGLFPLVVGEPFYEITSPNFETVTIQVGKGKKLIIKSINKLSPTSPIKQVRFNNSVISDFRINHNDIAEKGGVLELEY